MILIYGGGAIFRRHFNLDLEFETSRAQKAPVPEKL
jgi:hypothetical protein